MFIFAAINTVIVKRILPPLSTLPCCYLIFESLETRGEIDSNKKKKKWKENKLRQWVIEVWRGKQTDWHFTSHKNWSIHTSKCTINVQIEVSSILILRPY
jgi:hypothetical protein